MKSMNYSTHTNVDSDKNSYKNDDEFTNKYFSNLPRGGSWDLNNFTTIVNWLNLTSLYIVLLNYTIEYYSKLINTVTILCLVISTLSSTISLSQFSVTENNYPTTSIIIKIIFTLTSIITTILTGYLKISRTKEHLDESIRYHSKLMLFATELSSQLQLPIDIRTNAIKIIFNLKDNFKELFNNKCSIPDKVRKDVSKLLENDAIRERHFKNFINKKHTNYKSYYEFDLSEQSNNSSMSENRTCKKFFKLFSCFNKSENNTDLNYIYDASRLDIYFIFKDILYNELRNFENYLVNVVKEIQPNTFKYTITPTRILISVDDSVSNHLNNNTHLLDNRLPKSAPPSPKYHNKINFLHKDLDIVIHKQKDCNQINELYNDSRSTSELYLNNPLRENDNKSNLSINKNNNELQKAVNDYENNNSDIGPSEIIMNEINKNSECNIDTNNKDDKIDTENNKWIKKILNEINKSVEEYDKIDKPIEENDNNSISNFNRNNDKDIDIDTTDKKIL